MQRLNHLKAVAALGFFPDHIEHRVDQFSSFGVMSLGPVVTGARLTEDEIIRPEDLAVRSGADTVHRARLQINENGTRDVFSATGFVVIDADAFQLQFRFSVVHSIGLDAVLIRDDFPELQTTKSITVSV